LLRDRKYADARRRAPYERKIYSQRGEDGILAEIFRRIGTGGTFFVEFGAGDGSENNTAWLLENGWSGVWIEGDPSNAAGIRSRCKEPAHFGHRDHSDRAIVISEIGGS
jgi:hypothetical protein